VGGREAAREIRPIERLNGEEVQRGQNAAHGRHRHLALALLDLEATQILGRGGIGRAPKEVAKRTTSRM